MRQVFNLDMDWRFKRGDIAPPPDRNHTDIYSRVKTGNAVGPATKKAYDDSDWQRINVPHDYMMDSEITPNATVCQGYRVFENAWYRKTFVIGSEFKGSHALLVFEGISKSSVIYFNGSVVDRPYTGYGEIIIDVTDRIYYGQINTIAVYTRASDIEGWWYEGAGIYRHVKLFLKDPVHIAHNGIFAKPVFEDDTWTVKLETTLQNSSYDDANVTLFAQIFDDKNECIVSKTFDASVPADRTVAVYSELEVSYPRLWDIDDPYLYSIRVSVIKDECEIDSASENIGFRTFRMDADKGFFLNGRNIKIKGTCNHQDHTGLGVALTDSMQYYRVRRLKELGCNAYRCAHNPPAREILDACDRYGLIVMDENRNFETSQFALDTLETLVIRDRNHPSVLFYSLFNEEPLQNSREGAAIFKRLKSHILKFDDSRLILGAINDTMREGGTCEQMDVFGLNYFLGTIPDLRARFPHMPVVGSENCSAVSTRGCYRSDYDSHVLSGYDEETPPWGATIRENWKCVKENDFFAGAFIWTGFDYHGEPTPFIWPTCTSLFGLMDLCGFEKDAYYFAQATFSDEPMMYVLPHWNYNEGDVVRVMTVTNCEEVELFLNGRSLGRKPSDPVVQLEWSVPFEAGTLRAVGYNNGSAAAEYTRTTAGEAVALKMVPDRDYICDDGQDIVPIRISVVDKNGIELPNASNDIRFEIIGDGCVAGVGNGDPNSHEPENVPYCKLFAGLCQVLVKADLNAKKLTIKASSDNIQEASFEFDVKTAEKPNYIFSEPNFTISDIVCTVDDSETKPDHTTHYRDNDMNSFIPVVIEYDTRILSPGNFNTGWRMYRIPISLPERKSEGRIPALFIIYARCEEAQFYIGDRLIHSVGETNGESITIPLNEEEKSFEIRAVMKASKLVSPSGISGGVSLTTLDK